MNRRIIFAAFAALLTVTAWAPAKGADDRPNIIVIMADDMGYSDIGCYGGEIRTPHLDRLAQGGLRFTQFYNTGRCCPTRASLLTGLYPHQAGVGWMTSDNGHDGYRGDLNNRCRTIAEVLRPAGYRTYMSGKWHVTKSVTPAGPKDNWPIQRGFDRFYGTITGAGSFYDPWTLTRDNTPIVPDESPYYYTDAISNNAVKFIREHDPSQPFFMYVAFTSPHWPMHALEEDIERYKGRYSMGWDQLREQRYQRMQDMGLIRPEWKLTPRDNGVVTWDEATDKEWFQRRMEVYAAMVDRMDQGIGKILASLEQQSQSKNTLILFLADNGGCAEEYGSNGAVQPDPNAAWETIAMRADELQTAMQPRKTRTGLPVRTGYGVVPGPADTYVAYGKPWANASNTPFRRYKHWVHEGGISTPLIVHWPQGLQRQGELEHQPGHLIDIMATCIDVAQADYPKQVNGVAIQPPEGRSLAPAMRGEMIQREALYWEHEGNRAVRAGRWKLVADGPKGQWELYDLEADRTELNNLVEQHSDQAATLADMWEAYAKRTDVYPLVPWRKPKNSNFNRQQKRFELVAGDDLKQAKAPFVEGRDLTVVGSVSYENRDGVILAQGGSSHGYALYVRRGKLEFATRHSGKLATWSCEAPLARGKHGLEVAYPQQGLLVIKIDGQTVIEAESPGGMDQMPIDGLQVGTDKGGLVGEYDNQQAWTGDIKLVLVVQ